MTAPPFLPAALLAVPPLLLALALLELLELELPPHPAITTAATATATAKDSRHSLRMKVLSVVDFTAYLLLD